MRSSAPAKLAALALAATAACTTGGSAPDALKPGDSAPDVTFAFDDGTRAKLADLPAPVVVYFYPKDDTPGCTAEACAYRDKGDELAKAGIIVIGVSFDDAATHKAFRDKYSLKFKLATDDGSLAKGFGVEGTSHHARDTIVIGKDRKIAAVMRGVDPVGSVAAVLAALGG